MVAVHECLVTFPEQVNRVKQIMVELVGSVGIGPTIKITAFDQKLQDAH